MIELPERPTMQDYQRYIHDLEADQGWLEVDLVRSCFLMGEEVGELFKAVRKVERMFDEGAPKPREAAVAHVGEELVDVLNYLLAIANRLDIDVEAAFREKNRINQTRTWS